MRAHLLVHPLRCALASVPVDKTAAHFEAFARAEARVLPKKAPRRSRKAVILVIVDVKMLPASGASRYYFSTTATKAKFPPSTTTDGFMYAEWLDKRRGKRKVRDDVRLPLDEGSRLLLREFSITRLKCEVTSSTFILPTPMTADDLTLSFHTGDARSSRVAFLAAVQQCTAV